MSEVTIWTCDRCGTKWNSEEHTNPLSSLSIQSGWGGAVRDEWRAQWCEECRILTGVFRPKPKPEDPPLPEPLTLEGMIREIVREEIDAQ